MDPGSTVRATSGRARRLIGHGRRSGPGEAPEGMLIFPRSMEWEGLGFTPSCCLQYFSSDLEAGTRSGLSTLAD